MAAAGGRDLGRGEEGIDVAAGARDAEGAEGGESLGARRIFRTPMLYSAA